MAQSFVVLRSFGLMSPKCCSLDTSKGKAPLDGLAVRCFDYCSGRIVPDLVSRSAAPNAASPVARATASFLLPAAYLGGSFVGDGIA
jgi:hypothetical protein